MALPAYSDPSLLEKAVGVPLPSADLNKVLGMIDGLGGSTGRRPEVRREWLKAADIASAATVDLSTVEGNYVHVTGTTTITAFGTVNAGTRMTLRFAGILTVTHNATSLILANGVNLVTKADTVLVLVSEGAGNWREIGRNNVGGAWTDFTPTLSQGVAITTTVAYARYAIIGKTAIVQIGLTAASSGTSGSRIAIGSIPAAIEPKQRNTGNAYTIGSFTAASNTNARTGTANAYSATEFSFVVDNQAGLNWLGTAPSFQMISGYWIQVQASYEIA